MLRSDHLHPVELGGHFQGFTVIFIGLVLHDAESIISQMYGFYPALKSDQSCPGGVWLLVECELEV